MSTEDGVRLGRFDDVALVMISRNEQGAIEGVISGAQRHLPGAEIVLVDGSTDETPAIASRLGARVIAEPGGGPAPALLAALAASDRPIIATIDADATYPAEVLPALVALVRSGFDVAGTDRFGFGRPDAMPLANYVANRGFNLIARARWRRRVRDVHSGQRAYGRAVLEAFDWSPIGLALPVDLLVWPIAAGYQVIEVPIEYRERIGHTKLVRLPGTLWTLRRLVSPVRRKRSASGAPPPTA